MVQAVTLVLAVLAIIWHQTRSTDKLRDEIGRLGDKVEDNGQRLARIEGFLGIGMPKEAAERAAGAAVLPADRQ